MFPHNVNNGCADQAVLNDEREEVGRRFLNDVSHDVDAVARVRVEHPLAGHVELHGDQGFHHGKGFSSVLDARSRTVPREAARLHFFDKHKNIVITGHRDQQGHFKPPKPQLKKVLLLFLHR